MQLVSCEREKNEKKSEIKEAFAQVESSTISPRRASLAWADKRFINRVSYYIVKSLKVNLLLKLFMNPVLKHFS